MDHQNAPTPSTNRRGKLDLLDAIFDLSFAKAVTPHVIRWLYIIGIIGCGLATVSFVLAAFKAGFTTGLVSALFAPVLFAVYVLLTRVALELAQAVFRIADSLKRIEERDR